MNKDEQKLKQRLSSMTNVRVAVLGVGYVGLPLAVKLAEKGALVYGVDINRERIKELSEGKSPIEGIEDISVQRVVQNKKLVPLLILDRDENEANPRPDPEALEPLVGVDAFIVCVPTPLHPDSGWQPDMRWIEKAAKLICHVCELEEETERLPHERLIVLESTTYPGTTRKFFGEPFDRFKKPGAQWYLAYSPERTNPGLKVQHETEAPDPGTFQIKRIIGGLDAPDRDNAVALYQNIFDEIEPVDSLEAAEMIKLVENTFRFIAIGFANEMARIARSFGLNIWDIIRAAKTKKFGLDMCYPGLVGGHCIPIDPHYLNWAVRNQRQMATFIDVAENAHQRMRRDAVDLIQRLLNQNNKGVSGASILFLGVAYKENLGDTRESAILDLMKRFHSHGARACFWDPVRAAHADKRPVRLEFSEDDCRPLPPKALAGLKMDRGKRYLVPEELRGKWEDLRDRVVSSEFDCVVLATDHSVFHSTYEELILADDAPPLADLRNAIEGWLWKSKPPEDKIKELRQRLSSRSKYMLLGLH